MKKLSLAALIMAGMTVFTVNAATLQELEAEYHKIGTSVVDMVNSRSVDVSTITDKVLELTKISVAISEKYKAKFPQGGKLIDTVINQVAVTSGGKVTSIGPMSKLSFKEMEDEWHDLGFLKSHDVGIDMDDEDNEHFTDPLHVMIHPIMVYRAAVDNDLDAMKSEMEEGLEQAALILEAF